MGTRSRIGIENMETGEVQSIYCHWDGYPEGVGRILVDHYATAEKVQALIALGALSSLRANVAPSPGQKHTFDDPRDDVTIAYGRDRGETDVGPETDTSVDAYYARAQDGWEEYTYLFRQGVWFYTEVGGEAGPFIVNAKDPNAEAEAHWKNLSGALTFGAANHDPSYAIG